MCAMTEKFRMRSCGICASPSFDPATTSLIVPFIRRPHSGSGRRRDGACLLVEAVQQVVEG